MICGCMFSGKTEELIRRLKRVQIANQRAEIFKPATDVRYDISDIVSHDATRVRSTPVDGSQNIMFFASDVDVVGVDEAQFFDAGLPHICEQLAIQGIRVIVAGLDMDYKGQPFGPIPAMLAIADYVTKLHAICMQCGDIATYSYRKSEEDTMVLLGEKDLYEPRCRNCFYKAR